MSKRSFLENLKERRVIRTTLLYVALLWVVLQAADLLANADIISEQLVRWIILLGAIGLPVAILASWFFESPWNERRWTAIAGDLFIIIAITGTAALFTWQHWFTSFTRPTIAVLRIEATDLRPDSDNLGRHVALRLRTALATRPEIRVIETSSSFSDRLEGMSLAEKATLLGADFVLSGTTAQLDSRVRLNVQVFADDGQIVHGATLEERLLDQAQLQNRVLAELWPQLPLPADGLDDVRKIIGDCTYPDNRDALYAIAAVDSGDTTLDLADFVARFDDSGMLQLARAKLIFRDIASAPAPQRPVMQQVAMQYLANAQRLCPFAPDWELMRLLNTQEFIGDELLHQYPNAAALHNRAAAQSSEPQHANALLNEARLLDPLGDW